MPLSIIKKILIQAGLLPLWLMPLLGFSIANVLIILSISFGLLSEGSVSFASMCFIVLIQGIISYTIMVYVKVLIKYITGKNIKVLLF
jgi:hypothetical protein